MFEFFVEKSANAAGEHVVHRSSCSALPAIDELYYIGVRSTVEVPLKEAENMYSKAAHCPECIAS